jgi:hypothetical protein
MYHKQKQIVNKLTEQKITYMFRELDDFATDRTTQSLADKQLFVSDIWNPQNLGLCIFA